MSFTSEVKSEMGQNILKPCCMTAQLSALIQLCSTVNINSQGLYLSIKTENATTAKRIWLLLKEKYDVEMELSVFKKMRLKKNNIYVIKVMNKAQDILNDLDLYTNGRLKAHPGYQIVRKECCARAYLAGAFMASGSVNSPIKSNYHLELATLDKDHALFILKLMHRFELPAKYIQRRNQHVVYLKASEKISDFMRFTGAHNSVMAFEDLRIQRDFRNSLTRLDNCELANEVKSLEAGQRQLTDIALLRKHDRIRYLDKKLQEVVELREDFPEASLNELCEEYAVRTKNSISKSGMKHRLAKLSDMASKLDE
ncbi:MAG: DNA-binding protein WhiA [Erysipelotrichaceae bacterium]|nr:DNA-binding protein WhiA [Erysipelotrichaceae bacterium]MDD3923783.1 DNA-binding protein WhiA [Erysipelotrichaceae bacterium]MDD4642427.1 DNA-binding protein WhiA [Erysipelotrichaceae bacterium]